MSVMFRDRGVGGNYWVGCTQRGSYSAKGRVSAFYAPSKNLSKNPTETLTRCPLRALLRNTSFNEPSKNPSISTSPYNLI